MLVCQPPGVWNKLPDGCGQLDKDATIDIDGKVGEARAGREGGREPNEH